MQNDKPLSAKVSVYEGGNMFCELQKQIQEHSMPT